MLKLIVYGEEFYNEQTEEFEVLDSIPLKLEHSLVSMSKWESKHKKPFLSDQEKTLEETLDYIEFMILDEDFPEDIRSKFKNTHFDQINKYIESSETATTFANHYGSGKRNSEVITSELVYYWMVAFNIPFECQYWNLNRLFTLVQICNIKNSDPKKMSRSEIAAKNHALNEQRKKELGTSG